MSIPSLKSPEDLRRLRLELLGVSVYRKVLVQPVSAALLKLMEAAVGEDPAKLCECCGTITPFPPRFPRVRQRLLCWKRRPCGICASCTAPSR